jgi:hypothetical protein
MKNHVHIICIPSLARTLALVFKPVHTRYVQHINWQQGICGRLWQGRFFSCPLDEYHLWAAIRHVERNPMRAGIVHRAEDYPWSSAVAHCGLRDDPLLFSLPEQCPAATVNWSAWLADADDERMLAKLRRAILEQGGRSETIALSRLWNCAWGAGYMPGPSVGRKGRNQAKSHAIRGCYLREARQHPRVRY